MQRGQLWLDYDDGEEDEHWEADITSAVLRNKSNEVIVEFSGHDSDEGRFSGSFSAKAHGPRYVGEGKFTVKGVTTSASVSFALVIEGELISIDGTWRDSGDAEAHTLTAEWIEPLTNWGDSFVENR